MISGFIQDYVAKNIWCAPFQDNQVILELTRMSFPSGTKGNTDIWWDDITLPDSTSNWTVYNIGQNAAWRTNFPEKKMKWFPLAYWGDQYKVNFDLYFDSGIVIPTYQAYVLLTPDLDYIIALRMVDEQYNLLTNRLYLRGYRNGFWTSDRSDQYPFTIEYGGGRVMTVNTLKEYIADIKLLSQAPGIVNIYHNGKWVSELHPAKVSIGDYVYYVHDGSVARVVDFKVSELREFMSDLDKLTKYLLHPAKESGDPTIRYRDDVGIHLYKKNPDGSLEGRYYHRNLEYSLRMLTHADYSIPVETVLGYIKTDLWTTRDNLYIRLHIRDSGYKRPLVDEHRHLGELYRLTDVEICRALLGIDATLPEWYAPNLESSYYTAVMRKWWPPFNYEKTLKMLGYDAISKLMSDSPKDVIAAGGGKVIQLDWAQRTDSTLFEYDESGMFLGHGYHSLGDEYTVANQNTAFAEIYLGKGGRELDWIEGNNDVTLEKNRMYRFYFCPKEKDVPTKVYQVAVPNVNYQIVDGVVKWIHRPTGFEGLVWSDKNFLINEVEWKSQSGVYVLTITHSKQLGVPLPIPTEKLFLLINGKSAVENIDYAVQWPKIAIYSKDLLNFNSPNKFVIVGMGMSPDLTRKLPKDTGFVYKGIVSANKRYDLRDEKVMRFVVDGKVKRRKDVYFAEDYPSDTHPLSPNGAIYESSNVYVPIRDIDFQQLDELRNERDDFTERLEDFLTIRNPQPDLGGPSPIKDRHEVYSLMLTQMLYDIEQGTLSPPLKPDDFTEVQRKVKPYLYLLPYEPSTVGINDNYVMIVPHPFEKMFDVDDLTYRFFESVSKHYLKGMVKINTHFRIKES